MLCALSADAWAQHYLTHFLSLADLAALHSACTSWFHWLEAPNARLVSTAPRRGQFTVATLRTVAQVAWVKPFVTELFICVSALAPPSKSQRFSPFTKLRPDARHDSIAWNHLLRTLPAFSQLSVLHLHYDESADVELFSLAVERCFTALSLSLRELSLSCPGVYGFSGAPTRSLMRNVAAGSRLEVLNVDELEMTEELFLELARLPSLTELRPASWDTQISEASWKTGFAALPNLERLWFGGSVDFDFNEQDSIVPLTALRQCRGLRHLALTLMVLTMELLDLLADSLLLLVSLHLEHMCLGSLDALRRFPRLTSLVLVLSELLDGSATELPPMAALTHLRVDDVICGVINVSGAQELFATLSERMPMLRLEGVVVDIAS